jgi:uncharacterized protein (DUF1330 family)
MTGYVIAQIDVNDAEKFKEYQALAKGTAENFGGVFIVRGGNIEIVEGVSLPRVVIIKFPSFQAAKDWYTSETYSKARQVRQIAAKTNFIIVEGS